MHMNPQDQQSNYWKHEPEQPNPINPQVEPAMQPAPLPTAPQASTATTPVEDESQPASQQPEALVRWTAREYVHLEKGIGWFVLFAVVVLGLIAVDVFFLKSWTFSVLVVVMAVAVIVYIRRPPRDIQYTLSGNQGLYVGEKLHHLTDFKAFGLIDDDGHHSIMLIPVKRFSPGVSVYFPEEAGEQIVDILGARLPMEELKLDVIDVLVRKLRL